MLLQLTEFHHRQAGGRVVVDDDVPPPPAVVGFREIGPQMNPPALLPHPGRFHHVLRNREEVEQFEFVHGEAGLHQRLSHRAQGGACFLQSLPAAHDAAELRHGPSQVGPTLRHRRGSVPGAALLGEIEPHLANHRRRHGQVAVQVAHGPVSEYQALQQ